MRMSFFLIIIASILATTTTNAMCTSCVFARGMLPMTPLPHHDPLVPCSNNNQNNKRSIQPIPSISATVPTQQQDLTQTFSILLSTAAGFNPVLNQITMLLEESSNNNDNEKPNQEEEEVTKDDDQDIPNEKPLLTDSMVFCIGIYKNYISPLLPPACRFLPTCSQYGVQAIEEFGPTKGCILTAWRILRCSPIGGKGYDPPKWPPVFYTYSSY